MTESEETPTQASTAGLDAEPPSDTETIREFHRIYYDSLIWQSTYWLGVPAYKSPLDFWVYQEILAETRPDLLIETGTADGGSALFFASILDLLGSGSVVSIDTVPSDGRPEHPRITYLTGSSLEPGILRRVREVADGARSVMVVLDSDHSASHVLNEIRAYAPMVTPGQYLVVEDTNLNGNPVEPDFGPGPAEAVATFLAEEPNFHPDVAREKFLLTFHPAGFLRRSETTGGIAEQHRLRQTVSEQDRLLDQLNKALRLANEREQEMRDMLLDAHEQLLRKDQELWRLSAEIGFVNQTRAWQAAGRVARVLRRIARRL